MQPIVRGFAGALMLVMLAVLGCGQPSMGGSTKPNREKPPQPIQPAKRAEPSEAPTSARPSEPAPIEAASSEPRPSEPTASPASPTTPIDIRAAELVPPGTSESNAEAFKQLAVAKGDGPPVGGIGSGGIHLDALTTGQGWAKSRCTDETTTFKIATNDRVNVCMRVVHERGTTSELSVEWVKNGKQARRSKVSVGDTHALLTRSYLPISAGYEGQWKALIKSVDGTVVGEVAFTVE